MKILDTFVKHKLTKMKKSIFSSLLLLMLSALSFAQDRHVVTGTVRDSSGKPLPGAGVLIEGSTVGTVTDIDGKYSLEVSSEETLEVSFLGFKTVFGKPGKGAVLDFVLKEDSNLLQDVVVVGYGTQARKTLTTSVSKVDGESLVNAPVNSVGDALKGRVAGLHVATSNALSGETPRFMIRGGSSITMNNDPIFIIDGALMDDLGGLNPNDIESLEILKDAASAGIYGARASNGVILVTTRKGNAYKGPQVVFDVQMGMQSPSSRWPIMV